MQQVPIDLRHRPHPRYGENLKQVVDKDGQVWQKWEDDTLVGIVPGRRWKQEILENVSTLEMWRRTPGTKKWIRVPEWSGDGPGGDWEHVGAIKEPGEFRVEDAEERRRQERLLERGAERQRMRLEEAQIEAELQALLQRQAERRRRLAQIDAGGSGNRGRRRQSSA